MACLHGQFLISPLVIYMHFLSSRWGGVCLDVGCIETAGKTLRPPEKESFRLRALPSASGTGEEVASGV